MNLMGYRWVDHRFFYVPMTRFPDVPIRFQSLTTSIPLPATVILMTLY